MRRALLGHPRLYIARSLLGFFFLILVTWHYWVLYDSLTGARADLLRVESSLTGVGFDATPADLARAEEDLRAAERNLSTGRRHFQWDPLIQLSLHLPIVGPQARAADNLIDTGVLLTQLGDGTLVLGREVVARRSEQADGQPVTASLVDLLNEQAPTLDRMRDLSAELLDRRLELGDRRLLPPLNTARVQLDGQLPRLVSGIEDLALAGDVLPAILGFEGERRYFVIALNNGELLPGGGLVSATGVMTIENGANGPAELSDTNGWKNAWEAGGGEYIEPPGPLKRYLLRTFTWNLAVSNWSPDFPTWAQQALEFYELVHGPQEVHGVIAVDLTVFEQLLALTGPIALDLPGFGITEFSADNAILELERVTRRASEPGEDRKAPVSLLMTPLLERVQQLPPDRWGALVDTVRALSTGRHIQMLSFDAREQAAIVAWGLDGAIDRSGGDFVSLNEASVLTTKLSLILEREADHTIEISGDGLASHTLRLRYRNPLPEWEKGKDPALVRALMGNGLYGAYLRVFVPLEARGFTLEVDGRPQPFEDRGFDAGRSWTGVLVPMASGAESEVVFRWIVPLASAENGPYELRVQKQPGLRQLCTRFHISIEGRPASATIDGQKLTDAPVCLARDVTVTVTGK